jgi:hypothetical protein
MVGDSFEVFRDEKPSSALSHQRRVCRHRSESLFGNLAAKTVDLVIALNFGPGQLGVFASEGVETVRHHGLCDLSHHQDSVTRTKLDVRFRIVDKTTDFCTVVADSLELRSASKGGRYESKVTGGGLVQRQ